MEKQYIVIKEFKVNNKNYTLGQRLTKDEFKVLPVSIASVCIHIVDYSEVEFALPFGLIFKSTEFKFPEYCEEESYEEMKNRLLCEVKGCEHCEAYRYFEMAFDKFFE